MDKKYLDLAYKQALKAFNKDEVPVGCIIVKDNKIISKGYNTREKDNSVLGHAEINAIKKASKKLHDYQLIDCDLYVTLEPCIMCAGAIIQSRISRVIFGAKDPKGGALGSSINILDSINLNHKVEILYIEDEKCSNILKKFFKNKR